MPQVQSGSAARTSCLSKLQILKLPAARNCMAANIEIG